MAVDVDHASSKYPSDWTLPRLVERQVERTPRRIAASCEDERITYRQLNARANQVARYLQSIGAGPGTLVAIALDRSLEMIVGLLGILKTGAAYVPLDPSHPPQRLAYELDDCRARILVTQRSVSDPFAQFKGEKVLMDAGRSKFTAYPTDNLITATASADLVYVIYTSGSTGKPKGVAIPHGALVNFLLSMQDTFSLSNGDVFLAVTTIAFDIAGLEIWLPLVVGSRVHLARRDTVTNGAKLAEALARSKATFMQATPAGWQLLVHTDWPGQRNLNILCGGETLSPSLASELLTRGRGLWNLYGPTETTVWSTVCRLGSAKEPISIGRPIANTQVYVLDDQLQPVDHGETGELYIGGAGLAIGYLNRPQMTAERFIRDPFRAGANSRIYKTGDLARFLEDGSLQCLGRMDRQVKIRGFRVELGEIESILDQHMAVRQAVVELRESDNGDKQLVAFLVPERPGKFRRRDLVGFLKEHLPDYMVPALFQTIDRIPLTANGKVDHAALPVAEPHRRQLESEDYVPPSTRTEQVLADIWSELLGIERPGRHDNFFDLGGHSLRAMVIAYRIGGTFGVEIPLYQMFECPTVAELARRIDTILSGREHRTLIPIHHRPSSGPAPLSFDQERLWLISQFEKSSPLYNESVAMRLRGNLDLAEFQAAIHTVVNRHDVLRASFPLQEGRPVQVVAPAGTCNVRVNVVDFEAASPADDQPPLRDLLTRLARRPFDLETGPLVRATLVRISAPQAANSPGSPCVSSVRGRVPPSDSENKVLECAENGDYIFLVSMHHIICDEWSMDVLMREMSASYAAALESRQCPLGDEKLQFADYARWQREQNGGAAGNEDAAYWKQQLDGAPRQLALPTDRPGSTIETHAGAVYRFPIPTELTEALQRLGREQGITLFMTTLALFRLLLWRWSGQDDATVGTPIANRDRPETHSMVGFFLNMLAIRTKLQGDLTVRELLRHIGTVVREAYRHGTFPFVRLVESLHPDRHSGQAPLFQHVFVYQHGPSPVLNLPQLSVEPIDVDTSTAKFDLTFFLRETDTRLDAAIEYRTDLFDSSTIERFSEHFVNLARAAANDPDQQIGRIDMLASSERRQLLVTFNDTRTDYPHDACIHRLFEAQVERTPDAAAIVCGDVRISYRALNCRARCVAKRLRSLGAHRGMRIGIWAKRSVELVTGILGILKVGGTYVPLDPTDPAPRLEFIIRDTGLRVIAGSGRNRQQLPACDAAFVDLEGELPAAGSDNDCPTDLAGSADDVAYVMYTSGSTGQPKGVEIPHRGVVRLVCGTDYVPFGADQVFLLLAPPTFDASTFELWAPLLHGATLIIHAEPTVELRQLQQTIDRHGVTCLWLTSALFNAIIDQDPNILSRVKYLLTGGEALSVRHVRQAIESLPDTQIINGYGPTESTTFTCTFPIPRDFRPDAPSVPIGRPIANTRVYILDRAMQPVPIGAAGELYIGGDGLAIGYASRPELTRERFVTNPFAEGVGDRLYRTGDRCRYLPSGDIEFLGRLDRQIKIRGFRVEPGEIEAVLGQHRSIKQIAVVAPADHLGDTQLAAYMVLRDTCDLTEQDARVFLSERLPDYMIPTRFHAIGKLPTTPNGKVDRLALLALTPAATDRQGDNASPASPTETAVADIWSKVLGVDRIGIHDNFFELGGHSLRAMVAASRIRQSLGVVIPLHRFFDRPTVADLAHWIDTEHANAEQSGADTLSKRRTRGPAPLSPDQERIWFLSRLEEVSSTYHETLAMRLTGDLHVDALQHAINTVVDRHDALRTHFTLHEGRTAQLATSRGSCHVSLEVVDVDSSTPESCRTDLQQLLIGAARRPFDLASSPLIRALLFRTAPLSASMATGHDVGNAAKPTMEANLRENGASGSDRAGYILMLVVHHIICDEWSMNILVTEMSEAYRAVLESRPCKLPPIKYQFSDYASWQRRPEKGAEIDRDIEYWTEKLRGAPPLLELPTDRPRPAVQTYRGAVHPFRISAERVDALARIGRPEGLTPFMTMLSLFNVLLARWSGQEDMVVGTPISRRDRSETQAMVGFFLNMLAIRTVIRSAMTFRELMRCVARTCREAFEHQQVPFERLVEVIRPERSLGYPPLFQTMFVLNDIPPQLELPNVTTTPLDVDHGTAKFDLTLYLRPMRGGLDAWIEYNTDLFDAGTIQRLASHYLSLARSTSNAPDTRIDTLDLMKESERHQLLVTFNDTRSSYPREDTVQQLVERQVELSPDRVAVEYGDKQLSYRELNDRANRLARHLQRLGVGPETRVAICVDRSLEMVIGLLGIVKAGAAYVPIDPRHPRQRVAFVLEDCKATVLVTHGSLKHLFPAFGGSRVLLDDDRQMLRQYATNNLCESANSENLVYVLYTSGSTGEPKGVAVPHRALINFLCSMRTMLAITQEDILLAVTTLSFDIAGLELWLPLIVGARVQIAESATVTDGKRLAELLARSRATFMQATPAGWQLLLEAGWPGEDRLNILCGGDTLPPTLAEALLQKGASVWNLYGPTETTIWSTACRLELCSQSTCSVPGPPPRNIAAMDACQHAVTNSAMLWGGNGRGARPQDKIPPNNRVPSCASPLHLPNDGTSNNEPISIGRPIANTQVYVLDHRQQPAPIGQSGDLYIGGDGLARGYLNHDALTRERFLPNPFTDDPAARVYKTGDLAAFRPDGSLIFLGRRDRQIKLRGFRIELQEVEAVLGRHPSVRQVAVAVRGDDSQLAINPENTIGTPHRQEGSRYGASLGPAGKHLVAYVVVRDGQTVSPNGLRAFLKQRLPDYMIPALFQVLDELPLTSSGKVDRRSLPVAEKAHADFDTSDAAPRNALERTLAGIWADILGIDPPGIHDNFFDLGGHSLVALRMLERIRSMLGHDVPLVTLMETPTIEHLADMLGSSGFVAANTAIVPIRSTGDRPPLFGLAGLSGVAMFTYYPLARHLGQDQPIYGLQLRGLDGKELPQETIEEMATYHIGRMRTVQPEGPYSLIGFSFGGLVVFEMARQLLERKEALRLVALIDAAAPGYPEVAGLSVRLLLHFKHIVRAGPGPGLRYVWDRVKSRGYRIKEQSARTLHQAVRRVEAQRQDDIEGAVHGAAIRAYHRYAPRPCPCEVILFRAEEQPEWLGSSHRDPTNGWGKLAMGGVQVHVIPGDHLAMVREPNVAEIGKKMRAYLDAAGVEEAHDVVAGRDGA